MFRGPAPGIEPLCVLDFYVHESVQRTGVGPGWPPIPRTTNAPNRRQSHEIRKNGWKKTHRDNNPPSSQAQSLHLPDVAFALQLPHPIMWNCFISFLSEVIRIAEGPQRVTGAATGFRDFFTRIPPCRLVVIPPSDPGWGTK